MLKQAAFTAVLVQAVAISRTAGHGNIILPKPTGNAEHPYYIGGPAGTIDMKELVGGASYGDFPKYADEYFTKNNIASLKDYITKYGTGISECGNTAKDGTPQPVPSDGYAQHDTLGNSHPGPCEIWCDDTRVYHNANCAKTLGPATPTKIPIDVSTCKSSSEFVFYWLALHAQPWQVYINCVALDGATGASSTNSTSSTTTTITTSTTTSPTSVSSDASAGGGTTNSDTTTATTAAPTSVSSDAGTGGDTSNTDTTTATTTAPTTTASDASVGGDASSPATTAASKCTRRRRS